MKLERAKQVHPVISLVVSFVVQSESVMYVCSLLLMMMVLKMMIDHSIEDLGGILREDTHDFT